jgi:ABC-type transport system involved in multi-copper enzyme maturation permease subunit
MRLKELRTLIFGFFCLATIAVVGVISYIAISLADQASVPIIYMRLCFLVFMIVAVVAAVYISSSLKEAKDFVSESAKAYGETTKKMGLANASEAAFDRKDQ